MVETSRGRRIVVRMHSTRLTHATPSAASPPSGGGLTRDEVMTAREVAELLHLPVSTVY